MFVSKAARYRKFSLFGLQKILELQQKQRLEQNQKQQQKLGLREHSSAQKLSIPQTSRSKVLKGSEKDLSLDLDKGIEKTIEILLKPEHTSEQIPYRLSQEAERRRRKKQSQRLSR